MPTRRRGTGRHDDTSNRRNNDDGSDDTDNEEESGYRGTSSRGNTGGLLIDPQKLPSFPFGNGTLSTGSVSTLNTAFLPMNRTCSSGSEPLIQRLRFYIGLTAVLVSLFILSLMSLLTLSLLMMSVTSAYLFVQSVQAQIRQNGLLPYLPQTLREVLTSETTLDEWMRDDSFMKEYRYLMLYFIPGIDLDRAIVNLPPRRREQLLSRRTMGGMMGLNDILYPGRGNRNDMVAQLPPIEDLVWEEEEEEVDRDGFDDDQIGLDIENKPSSISRGPSIPREQANIPREQEYDLEEIIISSAITSFVSNTVSSTTRSVTSFLQTTLNIYSPMIIRANLGVFTFSSLGLFGWRQRWAERGNRNMGYLFYLGMGLSSASVGGMMLLRHGVNYTKNTKTKDQDKK